jgi:hypothetical protein
MNNRTFNYIIFGAIAVFFVTKLAISLKYIAAGIDCADEGQVLMGYRYPFEYKTFPFYQFACGFFGNFFGDLVNARIGRLIFETLSITLISHVFYLWFTALNNAQKGLKLFALIWLAASLSAYSFVFGRVLMYDDFIFLFSAVSLWLVCIAWFTAKSGKWQVLLYLISGVFIGFLFFIKATVSAVLFTSYIILGWLYFTRKVKSAIGIFAAFTVGGLTGLLIGIDVIGGLSLLKNDFAEIHRVYAISAYNPVSMLINYWHRDTIYLVLLLVSALIHYRLLYRNSNLKRWLIGFAINIAFAACIYYFDINFAPVRYLHILMWLVTSSCLGLAVCLFKNWKFPDFNLAFIFFLLLLPAMLAFGTANSIYENATFFYSIYYILAFLAAFFLLPPNFRFVSPCLLMLSVLYFGITQVLYPYGLPTGLFSQNEKPLSFNPRITADTHTANFFNDAYKALSANGYKSEDNIVTTAGMTGLVSTLSGKMPATLYLNPGQSSYCCYMLHEMDTVRPKPFLAFFDRPDKEFQDCLEKSKINFPASYQIIAALPNPYKEAYKIYYGGELQDSVFIYAPIIR